MVTVYVGNLPPDAKPETVEEIFARFGRVESVSVYEDGARRRPRSYCLVEMRRREEARRASFLLNGQNFRGRFITVETVTADAAGARDTH